MNKNTKFIFGFLIFFSLIFSFNSAEAGFFDWFSRFFGKNDKSAKEEVVLPKYYRLDVSSVGSGTVIINEGKMSCGKECRKIFPEKMIIELTAKPDINYFFKNWSGCDSPLNETCEIEMNKSKYVIANFSKKKNVVSSWQSNSSKITSSSFSQKSSSESSAASSKTSSSKIYYSSKSSSSFYNKQIQNSSEAARPVFIKSSSPSSSSSNLFPVSSSGTKDTKTGQCSSIFSNGSTDRKINIYFYENGFNQKINTYDTYVEKVIAATFSGSFGGDNFPGVEPFKTLRNEFNVFSYKDEANLSDGSCWPPSQSCNSSTIRLELSAKCAGFVPTPDFLSNNGNYNIIVVPFDGARTGTSRAVKRLDSKTIRIGSSDIIYHNVNDIKSEMTSIVHEFGHIIGLFDEEYSYYDPYLGAATMYPNVDSASCTKWCGGVDKQSSCYERYSGWVDCFKEKFVNNGAEIKSILEVNNLNYTAPDFSWWGTCFDIKHINICGGKIKEIVEKKINPAAYGLNQSPDPDWVSNWEYCKNQFTDVWGSSACNLGLNCGENGCYAGQSLSKFTPSPENSYLMGNNYGLQSKFNKHDEDILRYNILNKVRYIDVENPE
ncbi:MAG: hypothetical protein HUT38_01005 [Candidatus Paceibacter sp.]|nr:hypothetical protein [Candidatus Paceibacter sp.]